MVNSSKEMKNFLENEVLPDGDETCFKRIKKWFSKHIGKLCKNLTKVFNEIDKIDS